MRARPRDFIYTRDDLFLATNTYLHPEDKILAFLRYIPKNDGEREKDGRRYSKVDSKQAYEFLNKYFPEYLFECEVTKVQMMGVPIENVDFIYRPNERLMDIINSATKEELLKKVVTIAETFQDEAGIPMTHMGVSGSILPGLYDTSVSDIDFVIYGLKNHRKAMKVFAEMKNDPKSPLRRIDDTFWRRLYEKRIKDLSLNYDEFIWYESRKNNRGVINGTLFDILATRDWSEIKGNYGEKKYTPMGTIEIEATISNAIGAFDNPAVYEIEELKIIDGPDLPVTEVASYTHTYSGQAKENERIIARGKLEKVEDNNTMYRLVVGTTRESLGEYIKLKKLELDKVG
jgi:predicted nucleotidyltransferase